jgi:hypothetical protein
MDMQIKQVQRDQSYTLWSLAQHARMSVEEIRRLVERGQLDSHYTDGELYVNGKDFLEWAEKQKGEQGHYQ